MTRSAFQNNYVYGSDSSEEKYSSYSAALNASMGYASSLDSSRASLKVRKARAKRMKRMKRMKREAKRDDNRPVAAKAVAARVRRPVASCTLSPSHRSSSSPSTAASTGSPMRNSRYSSVVRAQQQREQQKQQKQQKPSKTRT